MEIRIARDDLKQRGFGEGVSARLFNGAEHGLSDISLMFGEVEPGASVRLHRHTYEELFLVHQGQADFTIDETTVAARGGDLILIPAGVPHRFVNTGDKLLRQTAVHASKTVIIEWLD